MHNPQILVTQLTPAQFSTLIRQSVRAELDTYGNQLPRRTSLPELPTKRQTREFLGISNSTLVSWAKPDPNGSVRLAPLKIGARIRYRRDEVVAALKAYQAAEGRVLTAGE